MIRKGGIESDQLLDSPGREEADTTCFPMKRTAFGRWLITAAYGSGSNQSWRIGEVVATKNGSLQPRQSAHGSLQERTTLDGHVIVIGEPSYVSKKYVHG